MGMNLKIVIYNLYEPQMKLLQEKQGHFLNRTATSVTESWEWMLRVALVVTLTVAL